MLTAGELNSREDPDEPVVSLNQPIGRRAVRRIRAALAEPLVHFLLLGAALFLIWPFIADRVAPPSNQIVISQSQMQRAIEVFYKTHLHPPTTRDLNDLAEQEIKTEIYYREGVALGLDRDDEIIQRRIAQKLQFMTQDIVDQQAPSDADLQRFLDSHREDFGAEAQIAFSQVYLNPDRHREMERDVARILSRLNSSDGRLNYGADSDVLPLPNDFEATPLHVVANMFGGNFATAVEAQPLGHWAGPIRSGYGVHLVLVRERRQGSVPRLSQIRSAVLREWQSARRIEANAEVYQRMRAKYNVKVEMPRALPTTAIAGLETGE